MFGDLETYCEIPLKNGTHAYSAGVEVMLFPYALDDGPIEIWDLTEDPSWPAPLADAWVRDDCTFVFHNVMFDRTMMRAQWGAANVPRIERWHCTMARALAHGLPGGLDKLGIVMGLPDDQTKAKDGKQLIQLFCKPRPKFSKIQRATRHTHPAEWERFKRYACQDVEAMRVLYRKLPCWNYEGRELDLWRLDQRINERGVAVDLGLTAAAIRATTRAQQSLAAQAVDLTDGAVESTNQRDKLLAYLLAEHGVDLPDMRKETLERRLEDDELPDSLRQLLRVRLQSSSTSSTKWKRILNAVSSDGRVRGLLQFCGAARTGRWAGRTVQPQNFPRLDMRHVDIDVGIEAMLADCEDLAYG